MPRSASPVAPLWGLPVLHRASRTPAQEQIARHLREAILAGRLVAGARLPSSRALAADVGVSRGTAVLALERVAAEGLTVSRPGAGLYVAPGLRALTPPRPGGGAIAGGPSRRGTRLAGTQTTPARRGPGLLAPGVPALDAFPADAWAAALGRFWRRGDPALRGYADPAGLPALREALARHLAATRGFACGPEDIVITSGAQQAIWLCGQMLLDPGNRAVVEDPAYVAGRGALLAAGAEPLPAPVDIEGIDLRAAGRRAASARLALVTPSHQYPTGAVLSASRRLVLLDWAERGGRWVVEDDYDSDFRYGLGRSPRPLRAFDHPAAAARVVFVGTFSKALAPGLRLGFLVAPPGLAPAFAATRALIDRHPPAAEQGALAEFLAAGRLSAHLRRARTLYAARRVALLAALDAAGAATHLDWSGAAPAGLHLAARLRDGRGDDAAWARAAAGLGLAVPPLSAFALDPAAGPRGLVLGFANTPSGRMGEAVAALLRARPRR